ncbi:hypothetical protein ABPG72_007657 [Tetrahymena utriculariae]
MMSSKQLFLNTKNKLIDANLILESSIETPIIKYKLNHEERVYDLSNYFQDYYTLLKNVPTYVSDNSYVLKQIPNIKELTINLSESFKSPENSSMVHIEFNIEVQMLSKMFSQEQAKVNLISYIYYQTFSEWLKNAFSKINYNDYECKLFPDEGILSHNVRVLGNVIYSAFNQEAQKEESNI